MIITYRPFLASLQFDIPKPLSNSILEWGDVNIPEIDLSSNAGREEKIHLTILKGLSNNKNLWQLFKNQKPIPIELGLVSVFENLNFNVVKIDVISEELHKFHKKLSCDLPNCHYYTFHPHITIAYTNNSFKINSNYFQGIKLLVNNITFSTKDRFISNFNLKV